jgi:hypothetical protein
VGPVGTKRLIVRAALVERLARSFLFRTPPLFQRYDRRQFRTVSSFSGFAEVGVDELWCLP